jgi:hypothetical protein
VETCYVRGDVSGNNYVGGIVGRTAEDRGLVSNCVVISGNRSAQGVNTGRISGTSFNLSNNYFVVPTHVPGSNANDQNGSTIEESVLSYSSFWDTVRFDFDVIWQSPPTPPTLRNVGVQP